MTITKTRRTPVHSGSGAGFVTDVDETTEWTSSGTHVAAEDAPSGTDGIAMTGKRYISLFVENLTDVTGYTFDLWVRGANDSWVQYHRIFNNGAAIANAAVSVVGTTAGLSVTEELKGDYEYADWNLSAIAGGGSETLDKWLRAT